MMQPQQGFALQTLHHLQEAEIPTAFSKGMHTLTDFTNEHIFTEHTQNVVWFSYSLCVAVSFSPKNELLKLYSKYWEQLVFVNY